MYSIIPKLQCFWRCTGTECNHRATGVLTLGQSSPRDGLLLLSLVVVKKKTCEFVSRLIAIMVWGKGFEFPAQNTVKIFDPGKLLVQMLLLVVILGHVRTSSPPQGWWSEECISWRTAIRIHLYFSLCPFYLFFQLDMAIGHEILRPEPLSYLVWDLIHIRFVTMQHKGEWSDSFFWKLMRTSLSCPLYDKTITKDNSGEDGGKWWFTLYLENWFN